MYVMPTKIFSKNIFLTLVSMLYVSLSVGVSFADTVNARFPENPKNKDHVFTRMYKTLPAFAQSSDT